MQKKVGFILKGMGTKWTNFKQEGDRRKRYVFKKIALTQSGSLVAEQRI